MYIFIVYDYGQSHSHYSEKMPEEQKKGFVLLRTQFALKLMVNDQKWVGTHYYDKYIFKSRKSSSHRNHEPCEYNFV